MCVSTVVTDLGELVAEKRRQFAARNLESARLHDEARLVLPGGHTRASIAHEPFPLTFVRGEGARLWDSEGREYLDFLAGISVCSVGHCHPEVVAAVREQAGRLMHVSNLFYTEPMVRLAERLSRSSLDGRVFFVEEATWVTGKFVFPSKRKILVIVKHLILGLIAHGHGCCDCDFKNPRSAFIV